MDLCVTIKGVSFLLQTGLGVLANAIVLLAYAQLSAIRAALGPVDAILCHLALADLFLLLTRGVPQTLSVFGFRSLLDDAGCKVVIYCYRLARALSVCLTCLLSVYQALMLAPAGPLLTRLRARLPQLVLPSFLALWILNMAVCIAAPLFSVAPRNNSVPPFTLNLGFCLVDFHDNLSYVVNGVFVSLRDFLFVGGMLGGSGYMLAVLRAHGRRMQGVKRAAGGGEARAARTVLLLVLLYTLFFGVDNVIWIYMLTETRVSAVVADMRLFFSSCYASFSPLLIICTNRKIRARVSCSSQQGPEEEKK
ncbi:hypothetical protein DNTS_006261 [Danionella cerebrum]|uniref:Vomeronasal type-1 receptor n=1 Tax=Danionella cerebrum TaxID=2873325 RepID=A0A553QX90_9TELE|nr:hypothetical protein DNTS_006261 [Danionella translucida]